MMPAHFGMPEWQRIEGVPAGDSLYDDVTMISIDNLTDEEKLKTYLPRPYELDGPPVLTVAYSMNRDISWLAGTLMHGVKSKFDITCVKGPAFGMTSSSQI